MIKGEKSDLLQRAVCEYVIFFNLEGNGALRFCFRYCLAIAFVSSSFLFIFHLGEVGQLLSVIFPEISFSAPKPDGSFFIFYDCSY